MEEFYRKRDMYRAYTLHYTRRLRLTTRFEVTSPTIEGLLSSCSSRSRFIETGVSSPALTWVSVEIEVISLWSTSVVSVLVDNRSENARKSAVKSTL